MAEMTLIKVGEIVDKPQHKRVKLMEKAHQEQRQLAEARRREQAREPLLRVRQRARARARTDDRPWPMHRATRHAAPAPT